MSHTLRRIGPIYDLLDGLRLQDVDGGCGHCGKRLAEVIHDPGGQWNAGQLVCIDCGTLARIQPPTGHAITVVNSHRAPGRRVARCTCGWHSQITSSTGAVRLGEAHLNTRASA